MRLTTKVNGKYITKPFRKDKVRKKLGKIEDIEEKFNIDVVEFFENYERTGVIKW